MNNAPGLWICIDGPDFTGKGTQTTELIRRLIAVNEDNVVTYTHEPTRNARQIKEKLKRESGDAYKDPVLMSQLYTDDRVDNERFVIRPTLNAGGIVVSNRHKYSTLAYQQAQGVSLPELIAMHKVKGVGTPDITLFLFVDDYEELRSRMSRTGKTPDKFEGDFDFQKSVSTHYRVLAELAPTDPAFYGSIHSIGKHSRVSVHDIADVIWQKVESVYVRWAAYRDTEERLKRA